MLTVRGQTLFLAGSVRQIYFDWLRSYRPDLVPRYEALYARGAYLPQEERRRLARLMRRCMELPGQQLFQYLGDDGQGGAGVVIGPRASARALREVVAQVRADPGAWIAQDAVVLSTHPTVIDGVLRPRHADLRPFVLADGVGGWRLLPGALTRVALEEGQMVVNSSRGGGGKDTWVLR